MDTNARSPLLNPQKDGHWSNHPYSTPLERQILHLPIRVAAELDPPERPLGILMVKPWCPKVTLIPDPALVRQAFAFTHTCGSRDGALHPTNQPYS